MGQISLLSGIACFSLFVYIYARRCRKFLHYPPLPPGPKTLPLIGNLLNIPTNLPWIKYHEWSKELHTDVIHLDVAGTSIVVLDNAERATALLEKRSHIYSGRPRMPMLGELMGWDYNLGFMPYGSMLFRRRRRKLLHMAFQANPTEPQLLKATHRLLRRLLDGSDDTMGLIKHMAGEIIMSVTYGIDVLPTGDPYMPVIKEATKSIAIAAVPGAFFVDAIPVLKYIPDWMPFAGFKRKAKGWRKLAMMVADMPFEATKQSVENGTAVLSITAYGLEQSKTSQDPIFESSIIRDTAGALYIAGADTTVSIIGSCILGLLTNPGVLKKAQQEIDLVLGVGRLPGFDDQESLPYVTAVVKESLRWRDVAPIGFPHSIDVEDVYNGYRIPAGSIVIANLWAMLHDETIYPEPFKFNPDRFIKDGKLDPAVRDPEQVAFGFGRRRCPGRHMALSSIWIAIASIIASFDITKAIDEDGNVVEPTHEYSHELLCIPLPFKCSMKPRSREIERLLRS
ncbi:cytochrome P450 [Collybia nuda]|uniref:Cytochrome P450 n=1 Tax=Collybia nuda TaxID=64659 RepID=A0A9P5Y6Y4_9AGAR|nr:cytochrome P450 [Collybia nuda]